MICPCGHSTVTVRYQRQQVKLCTNCGRLMQIDYARGLVIVIWPARRWGMKAG